MNGAFGRRFLLAGRVVSACNVLMPPARPIKLAGFHAGAGQG